MKIQLCKISRIKSREIKFLLENMSVHYQCLMIYVYGLLENVPSSLGDILRLYYETE